MRKLLLLILSFGVSFPVLGAIDGISTRESGALTAELDPVWNAQKNSISTNQIVDLVFPDGADNLGNHIATQDLDMNEFDLTAIELSGVIGASYAPFNGQYYISGYYEWDDSLVTGGAYGGGVHQIPIYTKVGNPNIFMEPYNNALEYTVVLRDTVGLEYQGLPASSPVNEGSDFFGSMTEGAGGFQFEGGGYTPASSPYGTFIDGTYSNRLSLLNATLNGNPILTNVTQSSVTQHESAINITTSQITDLVFPPADGYVGNAGPHTVGAGGLDMNSQEITRATSISSPDLGILVSRVDVQFADNLIGGETLNHGTLALTAQVNDFDLSPAPISYNISFLTLDNIGLDDDSIDIEFELTTDSGEFQAGNNNGAGFGWVTRGPGAWMTAPGNYLELRFKSLSVNLNGGVGNGLGFFKGFTQLRIQGWNDPTETALVNGRLIQQGVDSSTVPINYDDYVRLTTVNPGTLVPRGTRFQDWAFQIAVPQSASDLDLNPQTEDYRTKTSFVAQEPTDLVNKQALDNNLEALRYDIGSVVPVNMGNAIGTWIIDPRNGPVQFFTQTGAITSQQFIPARPGTDNVQAVEVILLTTAQAITWNAGIAWAEGVIPPTVNGEYNRLIFSTFRSSVAGGFLGSTP